MLLILIRVLIINIGDLSTSLSNVVFAGGPGRTLFAPAAGWSGLLIRCCSDCFWFHTKIEELTADTSWQVLSNVAGVEGARGSGKNDQRRMERSVSSRRLDGELLDPADAHCFPSIAFDPCCWLVPPLLLRFFLSITFIPRAIARYPDYDLIQSEITELVQLQWFCVYH